MKCTCSLSVPHLTFYAKICGLEQILQVFLYVHKIREDMLKRMEKEEVEEKENQEEDLEEDFNDLVKQLL